MARSNTRLWLSAGVLAGLLIAASSIFAAKWPFTSRRIRQSIEDAASTTITFHRFRQTYFPFPGCTFEYLSIPSTRGNGSKPLITAQHVRIRSSWADALSFRNHVAHVDVEGGNIFISATSSTKTQEPLQYKKSAREQHQKNETVIDTLRADHATLIIERASGSPLRFEFERATLYNLGYKTAIRFSMVFENPEPRGRISANGNIGPWQRDHPDQTPVDGDFSFNDANIAYGEVYGTLTSAGKFKGPLGHIEVDGNLRVPNFSVNSGRHSVDLKAAYAAVVNGTNGDVILNRVDSAFLRTRIQWTGQVAGQNGKVVTVQMKSADAEIEDLFLPFVQGESPFHGSVRFSGDAVLRPGSETFFRRLRSKADFGISGGQFTNSGTQENLDRLSAKASGDDKRQAENDPPDVISNLKGHVDLRNGIATFSRLNFGVPGAEAELSGTYDLKTKDVNLHGTLATQASLSKDTKGIKSFLLKPFDWIFQKKNAGAVVPLSITGTSEHPSYKAIPRPTNRDTHANVGRLAQ